MCVGTFRYFLMYCTILNSLQRLVLFAYLSLQCNSLWILRRHYEHSISDLEVIIYAYTLGTL